MKKSAILITGASGFLGSRIARSLLLDSPYSVLCLKRPSDECVIFPDCNKECIWYDYNGKESTDVIFREYDVKIIVHCATCYGRNGESWMDVYESNLIMPFYLFKQGVENGALAFINSDTFFSKAITGLWGEKDNHPIYMDEYVKSKYIFKNMAKDYSSSSDIIFINMMLEHMYGKESANGKFVNAFLKSLNDNDESIDLTDGNQVRDWLYVDDAVNAFSIVIEKVLSFEKKYYDFDIGTGKGTTVHDFCVLAKEISGSKTELLFGKKKMHEGELMNSVADTAAMNRLGWFPEISVTEGIKKILGLE